MTNPDSALRDLVAAISTGDRDRIAKLLAQNPMIARSRFEVTNATRQSAKENFVDAVKRYIYRGDTALHFAAAAYNAEVIALLVCAGADVRAKNRLGDEPLHSACTGDPASDHWKPDAQSAAIRALVNAGADLGARNKTGVTPLHKAVRARCAQAVGTLLELGADPAILNGSSSTPLLLARMNTGRRGSGLPAAKAQQREILKLLERRLAERK